MHGKSRAIINTNFAFNTLRFPPRSYTAWPKIYKRDVLSDVSSFQCIVSHFSIKKKTRNGANLVLYFSLFRCTRACVGMKRFTMLMGTYLRIFAIHFTSAWMFVSFQFKTHSQCHSISLGCIITLAENKSLFSSVFWHFHILTNFFLHIIWITE